MEHEFTPRLKQVLFAAFGDAAEQVFERSSLLQYLNIKTRSATRGSKSRGSFANLYAVYVLVEDYVRNGFDESGGYSNYEGAKFAVLLKRQRELPFGSKLQNHALNHRMNEEFKKYFPLVEYSPIIRDVSTNRYWINENLLLVTVGDERHNIASAVMTIIGRYIEAKRDAFDRFIETCERLKEVAAEDDSTVGEFVLGLLEPNVDARIFEIVSYAILKYYYRDQVIYFGLDPESVHEENLILYKTGRTNANDGGIDFVMRPLGRFFQVTETLDVRKYFLDIDKIERYPISFVIKSNEDIRVLEQRLREGAERQYPVRAIIEKYMASVEEIINISVLRERFLQTQIQRHLHNILDEIIQQSKVEFNYEDLEGVAA